VRDGARDTLSHEAGPHALGHRGAAAPILDAGGGHHEHRADIEPGAPVVERRRAVVSARIGIMNGARRPLSAPGPPVVAGTA
jgi:hypothetical protein